MTGIRMNLSHGPLAAHKDWLVMLHKAGVKKLLIDLQGPELRIGRLPQPLSLTAGQTVRLGAQGIPCPAALVHSVQPGQELLLDDGKLLARVDTAEPDALVCTVMRGGVLQSRKKSGRTGGRYPDAHPDHRGQGEPCHRRRLRRYRGHAALCTRRCGYPQPAAGAGRGRCTRAEDSCQN